MYLSYTVASLVCRRMGIEDSLRITSNYPVINKNACNQIIIIK